MLYDTRSAARKTNKYLELSVQNRTGRMSRFRDGVFVLNCVDQLTARYSRRSTFISCWLFLRNAWTTWTVTQTFKLLLFSHFIIIIWYTFHCSYACINRLSTHFIFYFIHLQGSAISNNLFNSMRSFRSMFFGVRFAFDEESIEINAQNHFRRKGAAFSNCSLHNSHSIENSCKTNCERRMESSNYTLSHSNYFWSNIIFDTHSTAHIMCDQIVNCCSTLYLFLSNCYLLGNASKLSYLHVIHSNEPLIAIHIR